LGTRFYILFDSIQCLKSYIRAKISPFGRNLQIASDHPFDILNPFNVSKQLICLQKFYFYDGMTPAGAAGQTAPRLPAPPMTSAAALTDASIVTHISSSTRNSC
jgi:hypothetical protein